MITPIPIISSTLKPAGSSLPTVLNNWARSGRFEHSQNDAIVSKIAPFLRGEITGRRCESM
jgi:hypothetical protein